MASTTPNYGLRKPANNDTVNVATDISGNMDLLDAHGHAGTTVPLPAGAPTAGQILSALTVTPLTTGWIAPGTGPTGATGATGPTGPTGPTGATGATGPATTVLVANTQTASYTLALTDAGLVVEMNVAGANTLTVPPNSSIAFPIGSVVEVFQLGAGQTTITPGAGVTIRSDGAKLKTTAQYATVGLRKRATDEWVASGDLSA